MHCAYLAYAGSEAEAANVAFEAHVPMPTDLATALRARGGAPEVGV